MLKKLYLLAILTILSIQASAQTALNITDFARHTEFDSIKVSPDGKFIAAGMNDKEGKRYVVIIDLSTKKVTARSSFTKKSRAGNFFWANKERLIIGINRKVGSLDTPLSTGELFAVNVDGRKKAMIFGYQANARRSEPMYAGATLLDPIKDDPKHILVSVIPYPRYKGKDVLTQAHKLNIYNGKLTRIASTPIRNGALLADHDLQVRIAIGVKASEGNKIKVYYRPTVKDKWKIIEEYMDTEGGMIPLAFTTDNKKIYVLSNRQQDTFGLYLLNPENAKMELLSIHKDVDIDEILFDHLDNLLSVRYNPEKSEFDFFDQSPLKKSFLGLKKAFKQQIIEPINISWDGSKIAIKVSSDTNSGDYYLFDTVTKKAHYLLSARSWENPELLHPVKPVQFTSSDNLVIHGYLTQPVNKGPHPLVVLPHGGPHGIRDYWEYNSKVQLLAESGYAVLQVNFRGSGGYGKEFEIAGYGQWGAKMQQDVTEGTQWAIDQGITSQDSICIFGGSYGAYAALMAVVNEPELYQCAIGYAGVYDLNMMFEEGDITWHKTGINFLKKVLGEDADVRANRSPVNHAEKITSAILLVHGKKDERAHYKHFKAMAKALKKAKHPFQKLVEKKEGHGFFKQENREKFYTKMLSFLDQHIGHKKIASNQ